MTPVKPTLLPAIVLNDEKKVIVIEHKWNGKSDRFTITVEGQKTMVPVHIRNYEYYLDENKGRKAVVYMLADDRLSDEQLGMLVTSMGPWFYTYGMRVES